MKRLIIAIVFAILSTAAFAQVKTETKTTTQTEQGAMLHCYFMKDGVMRECWGAKEVVMTKDVALKNGTKVSTRGEVTTKDGKKATLKNGEAILADNGTMDAFDKLHPKDHKMY